MHPTLRAGTFSTQWNLLSFRTPLFKGHVLSGDAKFGPIIMFTWSLYPLPLFIEGTPLFRVKGHLLSDLKPRLNIHSGGTFIVLKM